MLYGSGVLSIPHGVAQVRRISWVRGVGPVAPGQDLVRLRCGRSFYEGSRQQKTAPQGGFEKALRSQDLT